MSDGYRFGIEEEYFLADAESYGAAAVEPLESFHRAAADREIVEHELLQGQVEVASPPGTSLDDAYNTLTDLRCDLSSMAADHGLCLFAAGTHPTALGREQHVSTTKRYRRLGDELKLIAPKAAVSAMHIHVEVPDPERRINLINRLMPYLPLLHALSVSSPFFEGRDTGLMGYRLTAFSQWPRTGLPELFDAPEDYKRLVARLTSAGFIEDASFLWWHIRPSEHYPTIEMRVCDSCTDLEDATSIASLFRCLVRAVVHDANLNADFGPVERSLCRVNLWRAQQAGVRASFADTESDRVVTVEDMLGDLLHRLRDHAHALEAGSWLEKVPAIIEKGTSADRQKDIFTAAEGPENARIKEVVGWLARKTVFAT